MDALADAFPTIQCKVDEVKNTLYQMTAQRQASTCKDMVTFWDVFDFLEVEEKSSVNHSIVPKLIGLNLNQFAEIAATRRQKIPELKELRLLLKSGKIHRYIGQKNS